MKKTFSKLRSRRGESFVEVLVAIMVVGLAALLMASMVSVSGSIDMNTREKDKKFYEISSKVESYDINIASSDTTKVEMSEAPAAGGYFTVSMDVKIYTDADGTLKAYKKG